MRFLHQNKQLLVQQSNNAFVINFDEEVDKFGKPAHNTLATGKTSVELVVDPDWSWFEEQYTAANIAFVDFFNIYLASGDHVKNGEAVWSRPANATKGLVRLSLDGGHDVTFSKNGRKLFWFLGMRDSGISQLRLMVFFRPISALLGNREAPSLFFCHRERPHDLRHLLR